jgi:Protein of unknown function (DUF4232)
MRHLSIAAITLGAALVGCSPGGSVAPTATVAPTIGPSAVQTPGPTGGSPVGAAGSCVPSSLAARVLSWDAGAGHRTAHVELTNTGATSCTIHAMATPSLVDANGTVLINGSLPPVSPAISMAAGSVVKTEVQDDNYCGPTPVAPITVAFFFPIEAAHIVAAPVSATDSSGLPPCFGNPGSPGSIEMQPWAP